MTRWNRRMLFGALAVLVPALAGCEAGFNAPTLTYHPAAFGGYATHDGITIDNAFVLGPSTGVGCRRAGVFFGVVSRDGDRLVSISAPGTAPLVRIAGGAVKPARPVPVDLTGPEPKVVLTGVSSPLSSGSTVTLNFNFARAGTVTMSVPVEPDAYEYATFSPPPPPRRRRSRTRSRSRSRRRARPPRDAAPAAHGQLRGGAPI